MVMKQNATKSRSTATVPAGKFKATCLQLLDRAEQGESVTVTKRGRIVGRLVPPEHLQPFVSVFGLTKGSMKIQGDIVHALPNEWSVLED
jgi:prevent-host-death family protein